MFDFTRLPGYPSVGGIAEAGLKVGRIDWQTGLEARRCARLGVESLDEASASNVVKKRTAAVTIKDIAVVLGMAHSTVSRALNDHAKIRAETKQRVRDAADKLGYVANSGARAMRNGSMPMVGLIVPDVQNEFYSTAARTMAFECSRRGYQLVLGVSEDDPVREEQQIRTLRESRAAGVLIVPSTAPTSQALSLLRNTPVVQFLRFNRQFGPLYVITDDLDGTYRATEHLLGLGHRRIAFIGPARGASTAERRVRGYEAALRRAGIQPNQSAELFGPTRPEFGVTALEALLSLPQRPTAVVVASSRQVLGVLRATMALNVPIPEELSVVSYGDADWFEVCRPPITATALPVREMSERATSLLFQLLDNKRVRSISKGKLEFKTTLIVRGSTSRAGSVTRRRLRRATEAVA